MEMNVVVTLMCCCVDIDGSRHFVSRTGLSFEDVCSGCGVYNGCGCNFGSSDAPDNCYMLVVVLV